MTEAQKERDNQRSESEARDIIHDIDRLNTFPENKKTRWVWELLQNAKDVASPAGVDVIFKLEDDKVIISHNGVPFETKHLLAILYKTSTKTLGGEDGTTGKYGTDFVTTHILNKKLNIEGVLQNSTGYLRRFSLEIDRTSATLDEKDALKAMQESLRTSFDKIDEISATSPDETIHDNNNSFTYNLTVYSKKYAENGLVELERNIPFTLLINQREKKKINSITIVKNGGVRKITVSTEPSKISGLDYIEVGKSHGILFTQKDKILFGIPVEINEENYLLKGLENQSVLFKEFPLVGTENFNLPVFIQHNDFKPTELRDGIRTKKEREDLEEPTADINRKALTDFVSEYTCFLDLLINAKLQGLHHLVLSGLPSDVENYSNKEWYIENVQKPIREFLITKEIVQTVSGNFITIKPADFSMTGLIVPRVDGYKNKSRKKFE